MQEKEFLFLAGIEWSFMSSSEWVEAECFAEYSALISSVFLELICSCLQIVLFPGILNRCLQLFISIERG